MNYNQHMKPDISSQNANKLTHMLGEQFRKILDINIPECESNRPETQDPQPVQSQNRTSEDDRLEFLGYKY